MPIHTNAQNHVKIGPGNSCETGAAKENSECVIFLHGCFGQY